MSSRLAWAMLRVQDQPGVQNMILDKTKKVLVYSVEPVWNVEVGVLLLLILPGPSSGHMVPLVTVHWSLVPLKDQYSKADLRHRVFKQFTYRTQLLHPRVTVSMRYVNAEQRTGGLM